MNGLLAAMALANPVITALLTIVVFLEKDKIKKRSEDHQRVRGVIIALDDDKRIRRALQIAQGIDFYRYEVKFSLIPAS